ncbi:MAG: hypothetical protein ACI4E1_12080 [Lachnospira sp.]
MKSVRICIQNIRKWSTNSRIIMVLIFSVLSVFLYTSGISDVGREIGVKTTPWIFPFLFTYRYIKITLMIPCVFLFSDAPFIDSNQLYCIIRTGRIKWCIGQILYICVTSACYTLLLLFTTIISNITYMCWDTDWGELLGSAGTSNLMQLYDHQYDTIMISSKVIRYYTPAQAMFWSLLLMWISFVLLGLLMYVLNCIFKNSTIG